MAENGIINYAMDDSSSVDSETANNGMSDSVAVDNALVNNSTASSTKGNNILGDNATVSNGMANKGMDNSTKSNNVLGKSATTDNATVTNAMANNTMDDNALGESATVDYAAANNVTGSNAKGDSETGSGAKTNNAAGRATVDKATAARAWAAAGAEWAVRLRGARRALGGVTVLDGLDMTVPRGCTYALLGASGCGKTTLLRCLALGCLALQGGEAVVLGCPPPALPPARLGYMPQATALLGELRVREALVYYGRLLGLPRAAALQRLQLLAPLLQLPPLQRRVATLSGGQQRRVSLAAALIHEPELLILDEPTVGLDPLLRHSIWEYLKKLTEGGKATVIITTHYIEEALQADIVGLLRNGRLLAEDSPKHLKTLYNCVTLEEVFLAVSVKQDQEKLLESSLSNTSTLVKRKATLSESREEICMESPYAENSQKPPCTRNKNQSQSQCTFNLSCNRLKALLYKNFLTMCCNPGNMLAIFIFPFFQLSLFFLAIGGYPTGINLAVVNEEFNDSSNCFNYQEDYVKGFSDKSSYCFLNKSSCMYLNLISKSHLNMEFYNDLAEAIERVKIGKALGVIHFPKNFSEHLAMRLQDGIHSNSKTLQLSEIGINMDMTEQHTAILIKHVLYDRYNTMVNTLSEKCDLDITISKIPMQFKQPIYGPKFPRFDVFMLPGVLTSMSYFLATTLTAVILVRERQEGVWSRDIVAGVTSFELILSHILTQSVFVFLQTVELLLVAIYVYGMECKGNIFLLHIIILLQGFCGLTFGLVIAVLSKSITVAMYMCFGIYVPFINLSGMIWPIEGMPYFLQWVSYCMPTTLATISTNNVLQKAWTFFHPKILHGVVATIIWIFAQVIFAVCALRRLHMAGESI